MPPLRQQQQQQQHPSPPEAQAFSSIPQPEHVPPPSTYPNLNTATQVRLRHQTRPVEFFPPIDPSRFVLSPPESLVNAPQKERPLTTRIFTSSLPLRLFYDADPSSYLNKVAKNLQVPRSFRRAISGQVDCMRYVCRLDGSRCRLFVFWGSLPPVRI